MHAKIRHEFVDASSRALLVSTSTPLGMTTETLVLVGAPIIGLVFGSFASLAGYRLPRDQGVAVGRSRCPHCDVALTPRDLIPVVSWLLLGGRCRACGDAIHLRYPLTELATALGFGLAVLAFGPTWAAATVCGLALGLMISVLADLDAKIIPDSVTIWLLPLGLAHRWLIGADWTDTLAGIAATTALGLILRWSGGRLAGREALGLGDVKLLAVAGAWLGVAGLPAFLVVAGVTGVIFGLAWRRLKGEVAFPFGPALAVSLYAVLLWNGGGA